MDQNIFLGDRFDFPVDVRVNLRYREGHNGIAIGTNTSATYPDSLSIGKDVETTCPGQIIIGTKHNNILINEQSIIINGIDVLDEINNLKNIIKDQQRTIEALWDAPGMPGANQKIIEFENDLKN